MVLSIITINRNNAVGLEKTIRSVLAQTETGFEYIVVDGASTDESVGVIKEFDKRFEGRMRWISEPDGGIYSAMNKGIEMASGSYLEFLNSGDSLVSDDVIERIYDILEKSDKPPILYGNMLKEMRDGTLRRDRCFAGKEISFYSFYIGTLNHPPTFIRKDLFDKYGRYDESLKIVSDWKWFMQAIVLGGEKPVYTDVDVVSFDMNGISETNKELDKSERRRVLEEMINPVFLADYDKWSFPIDQMERIKRHPWAYKLVWFMERCLFKLERIQRGCSK